MAQFHHTCFTMTTLWNLSVASQYIAMKLEYLPHLLRMGHQPWVATGMAAQEVEQSIDFELTCIWSLLSSQFPI